MMKKILLGWLAGWALPLSAGDAVDAYLQAQMARHHIPGLAVAILREGKIEKLAAYGQANLEHGAPATVDTPFQIASLTKAYTGTLAMMLVEEGRLKLDAPISVYLGEVPEAWKPITVRQVLAHATGMKQVMVEVPSGSVSEAVREAQKIPLAVPPGTRSAYGSDDFTVLAAILEKVSGQPYPTLVKTRIWDALGLTHTRFEEASPGPVRTAEVIPGRASVYQWQGDRQRLHWYFYPTHTYAAGGAFSSARDLATFLQALDQGRLLSPASRAEMWQPFRLKDGSAASFGVGWGVGAFDGRVTVGHSGGPALSDLLYVPEERIGIVLLCNQQRLHPSLARGLACLLLKPRSARAAKADPEPALTLAHARLVAGFGQGTVDAAACGGELKAALPEVLPWMERQMSAYPPMTGLQWESDGEKEGHRIRTYLAKHGAWTPLRWVLTLDASGKVVDVDCQER